MHCQNDFSKPSNNIANLLYVSAALFIISISYNQTLVAQELLDGKPKLGLVLSGGGAKGLAHIGVLKVLEEAGIEIDMLGGTSMGSIVGGLYAMGYNAYEIESIVLEQDWMHLLTDKVHRNALSISEKEEFDKFIVNFPFEKFKLKLPAGLGAGQNISIMLSNLALPVADINDFNKLPIPFLCIGTNIVSGDEVVLNKGYLPDAIRASMAIPTIFTPVEIDGTLLVDGGLVNNFPVDRVKEMGAELIIGVNLGLKEYTKKDLENLATVLEQSLFFHAKERNKENQSLCDILISPDVYSSNASSFSNAAELIKIGEDAARKILPQLEKLSDSLRQFGVNQPKPKVKRIDSLYIDEIEYVGLEKVSSYFLQGRLKLYTPGPLSLRELEQAIERAYGTLFFDKITYKIIKLPDNMSKLVVIAEESKADMLRLGVRYDNQFRSQFLLNTTFRNKLIKGSKLSIDLLLGEYPRLTLEYKINTGWKPKKRNIFSKRDNLGLLPDLGLRLDTRSFDVYEYENSVLLGSYKYSYFDTKLYASSNISNSMYLEGGASAYFSQIEPLVSQETSRFDNQSVSLFATLKFDTRNKKNYYNKGSFVETSIESFYDMQFNSYVFSPVQRWIFKAEKSIPLWKRMSLASKVSTGFSHGDSIPIENRFFIGGNSFNNTSYSGVIPFRGLRFMEEWGYSAIIAELSYQYEFLDNHFFIVDGNLGKTQNTWERLFLDTNQLISGYGFRYGYSSIIGPIELGLHSVGHKSSDWIFSLNIGLYF